MHVESLNSVSGESRCGLVAVGFNSDCDCSDALIIHLAEGSISDSLYHNYSVHFQVWARFNEEGYSWISFFKRAFAQERRKHRESRDGAQHWQRLHDLPTRQLSLQHEPRYTHFSKKSCVFPVYLHFLQDNIGSILNGGSFPAQSYWCLVRVVRSRVLEARLIKAVHIGRNATVSVGLRNIGFRDWGRSL